jgi:WD40 repeat protein
MVRIVFLCFLVFLLGACQSAPATVPQTEPTATVSRSEIPLPAPTFTQTIAPTQLPSPTASPAELVRRAAPICENAFSALVETGPLIPPFASLKKTTYDEAPSWELSHQLPHLGSVVANEVKTLFCISETRSQVGTYTDGSPSFQLFWDVRVVSWPGGRVIGKSSFTGSAPPATTAFASGSAEGSYPDSEFTAWVFHQLEHPEFIHFEDALTSLALSPGGRLGAFGTAIADQVVNKDYAAQIFFFRLADLEIVSAVAGHQGMVTSMAFSPDGKILASSGYDLFVKFWDVASSRLLGQVQIANTPNSLAFSPDGATLAAASNLDVALIDVASMRVGSSIQEANGRDLVFSPDGDAVYVNSSGSIKIIDTSANMVMLTFPDPFGLVPTLSVAADGSIVGVTYESPERVDGFALSPAGSRVISYTVERSLGAPGGGEPVRLAAWDANTGKLVSETRFTGALIRTISHAPARELLAIGNGAEIWIWDTASWQVQQKLIGHVGSIVALAFNSEGTKLFSAGSDGTIRAWSLAE